MVSDNYMISDYHFKALACDSAVRSKLEAEMTYFQSLQRVWTQRRIAYCPNAGQKSR